MTPDDRQLSLEEIIDSMDAEIAALPVRIDGWKKRTPIREYDGFDAQDESIVLHIAGDGREYTRIQIACPEGWTVASNTAGTAYFDTPAGPVLPRDAILNGQVKVISSAGFPDRRATKMSREPWGGK